MNQHPIPQNVTDYQFRLVGDMTLKQFVELAAGVVVAVIIYNLGLPAIIKWPFIFIFASAGAAFAFLPLQGRPLDIWLKNLIKSVYMPTIFLWKKEEKLPDFFNFKARAKKGPIKRTISPEERAQYSQYMQSLPKKKKLTVFDQKENLLLENINKYLQTSTGINPLNRSSIAIQSENSPPSVRVRRLQSKANIVKTKIPVVKIAESFQAPLEIGTPYIQKKPPSPPTPPAKPKIIPLPIKRRRRKRGTEIVLPPPSEYPNIFRGLVLDNKGGILPNAIIEIRDKTGMPVRASKTNKASQFSLATPLQNGVYEVEVEHPNFSFDIIKLKAGGGIIPPIKIKAKKQLNN